MKRNSRELVTSQKKMTSFFKPQPKESKIEIQSNQLQPLPQLHQIRTLKLSFYFMQILSYTSYMAPLRSIRVEWRRKNIISLNTRSSRKDVKMLLQKENREMNNLLNPRWLKKHAPLEPFQLVKKRIMITAKGQKLLLNTQMIPALKVDGSEELNRTVRKTVLKRSKKKEIEDLLDLYKKDHKWIYLVNEAVFCSYCMQYCQDNQTQFKKESDKTFIKVGSTNIKKYNFDRHAKRSVHCLAVLQYGTEEEKVNVKFYLNQGKTENIANTQRTIYKDKTLLPIFKSIVYIVKNDHALNEVERLTNYVEAQGVEMLPNYRNHTTATEMMLYISDAVRNNLLDQIRASQAIGIQIDESTDISGRQITSVNVKYLNDGNVKNTFLCCFELDKADASTIYKQLKSILESLDLFKKVRSISTDGAPVLSSTKNGVAGKLLQDIPSLFHIHCIAHKLNLGISNACKADIYFKQINNLVYNLCKLFQRSPKQMRILDALQEELLGLHLHVIKPLDVRWLSNFAAIERIIRIYPAIVATLSQLAKGADFAALGLLKSLKDFLILGHMHILSDIYDIVNKKRKSDVARIVLKNLNDRFQDLSKNICRFST